MCDTQLSFPCDLHEGDTVLKPVTTYKVHTYDHYHSHLRAVLATFSTHNTVPTAVGGTQQPLQCRCAFDASAPARPPLNDHRCGFTSAEHCCRCNTYRTPGVFRQVLNHVTGTRTGTRTGNENRNENRNTHQLLCPVHVSTAHTVSAVGSVPCAPPVH